MLLRMDAFEAFDASLRWMGSIAYLIQQQNQRGKMMKRRPLNDMDLRSTFSFYITVRVCKIQPPVPRSLILRDKNVNLVDQIV